ncbi:MAG TPA: aminopeptidase P family protein [Polyangiaceae bacterium]|nr:aminopeptidase P family protein [Polyangiaceae bacterium]
MKRSAERRARPAEAAEQKPRRRGKGEADLPPAFVEFMLQRWKAPPTRRPPKVPGLAQYAARRRALSALFPGEVLVIPTGHERVRSNDTHYPFRPGTEFAYLTGNHEPDAVLVLEPKGRGHRSLLFVDPNPGKTDKTFFTDRHKGELWVGPRLGVEGSRHRYGVDEGRPLETLAAFARSLKGAKVRVLAGASAPTEALFARRRRAGSGADAELAQALSELRLVKDALEIRELEGAAAATKRALEDALRGLPRARSERELEAAFVARALAEGGGVGYGTIVAAGANACRLHWTRNDGAVRRGELVLIDGGVEARSLYTADVTRTFPVSGRFSPAQRAVYDVVRAAQRAAIEAVEPGADFLAPHRAATRALAEGLIALGVLRAPLDEAVDEKKQYYKRYTLHGTSHMLGLDVHDCARARKESYREGKLAAGMVLTIEPGLYFQPDDLTVPARLRGIGVRIEDDVLVTARGRRVLTAAIPREADEVEAWLAGLWGGARGEGAKAAPARRTPRAAPAAP